MSELSESQYRQKLRALIDRGIYDPDQLFRGLVMYYFQHDKQNDTFWDTQDDMEELFDAMPILLLKTSLVQSLALQGRQMMLSALER